MNDALADRPQTQADAPPRDVASRAASTRWIVLTCLLLGASGGFRYWREREFAALGEQSRNPGFALKEMPAVVGEWREMEGTETVLDPEIARLAGSTDHVLRTYINGRTGDQASVLLLYGPSQIVWGHSPEVCYPSTGHTLIRPTREAQLPLADTSKVVSMRQAVYAKNANEPANHEVTFCFRNGGQWLPDMAHLWKQFRRNPGMYKIQVDRLIKPAEKADDSTLALVHDFAEELERRLASTPSPGNS